eukprot:gb/GEZN01002572.1/.p1 GENE.gb/GEZN01002572.1/~~gb/GEZN01002572.1/.p1  ORF type:complete len:742 (+),score=98.84 gb/GEZN01002572.1/:28-2226(+)
MGALLKLLVMSSVHSFTLLLLSSVEAQGEARQRAFGGCTSLAISAGAMEDGSTVVTHSNDCPLCDFRVAYVPPRDWSTALAPIYMAKNDYPRFYGTGDSDSYLPENTDNPYGYKWPLSSPMGHIPQVKHTYAYMDGSYGLMNEHQVAIGESTCDARLGPFGIPRAFGGDALFDAAALSRIALQRCMTARCAVEVMGGLAEQYGFYGGQQSDWETGSFVGENALAQGGEALTVADGREVWVINLSPDDTGHSAVWAAQRVPEGHLTVVTNTFSIGEMDLGDRDNFMGSANLYLVAARVSVDFGAKKGDRLNFARVFRSPSGHNYRGRILKDRRKWMVFSKACPSCHYDPYLEHAWDDSNSLFPFSVLVQQKLSIEDVFSLHRDLYQGTPFDMTQNAISGPWGDPARARIPNVFPFNDPNGDWALSQAHSGGWERPISQVDTSYTAVGQSRRNLPDLVGGRLWYGPHAAVTTLFTPIYPGAGTVPPSLARGSLNKADTNSLYWAVCIVNNYISRFFNVLLPNCTNTAHDAEGHILLLAGEVEAKVLTLNSLKDQIGMLQELHRNVGAFVLGRWWDFFFEVTTYSHDVQLFTPGMHVQKQEIVYPAWWVTQVGAQGAGLADYNNQHPVSSLQTNTANTALLSPPSSSSLFSSPASSPGAGLLATPLLAESVPAAPVQYVLAAVPSDTIRTETSPLSLGGMGFILFLGMVLGLLLAPFLGHIVTFLTLRPLYASLP